MTIHSIHLSWFRGAAADATLKPEGGSIVVFGTNGSGNSSFVDRLETCVNGGKVAHLSHEYSGRHQEKALLNTHRPPQIATKVAVALTTGNLVTCEWATGAAKIEGLLQSSLNKWDYRRTILRQEEMAEFIRATKGEKYSAVLALLGLGHMEVAAENLRRISKETAVLAGLGQLQQEVAAARQRRQQVFGAAKGLELQSLLIQLKSIYLEGEESDRVGLHLAAAVKQAITKRLTSMDADTREAAALAELSSTNFAEILAGATTLSRDINASTEPLVRERLDVLRSAMGFAAAIPVDAQTLNCPACGFVQPPSSFRTHVANERERLEELIKKYLQYRSAISMLCDVLGGMKSIIGKADLGRWRMRQATGMLTSFQWLDELSLSELRDELKQPNYAEVEALVRNVVGCAKESASRARPDVQLLIRHREEAETIEASMQAAEKGARIKRVEALVSVTQKIEAEVREAINARAQHVFSDISADVQKLWRILQPADRITNVRLNVPQDATKAVEVALTFYGVDQESPRLTLSEGQRNALGLCIFLALAKHSSSNEPIILDDVVIRLDRDHRSNVAELLKSEFGSGRLFCLLMIASGSLNSSGGYKSHAGHSRA